MKPWCKKGDWVIFARYAGSRLPIEGGEVRILNDDEVLGTIGDPESFFITFNHRKELCQKKTKKENLIDVGETDRQLKLI